MIFMEAVSENKKEVKPYKINRVTNKKTIELYNNDPFFIKKHEDAEKFLKKVGLPEDFISSKK